MNPKPLAYPIAPLPYRPPFFGDLTISVNEWTQFVVIVSVRGRYSCKIELSSHFNLVRLYARPFSLGVRYNQQVELFLFKYSQK